MSVTTSFESSAGCQQISWFYKNASGGMFIVKQFSRHSFSGNASDGNSRLSTSVTFLLSLLSKYFSGTIAFRCSRGSEQSLYLVTNVLLVDRTDFSDDYFGEGRKIKSREER